MVSQSLMTSLFDHEELFSQKSKPLNRCPLFYQIWMYAKKSSTMTLFYQIWMYAKKSSTMTFNLYLRKTSYGKLKLSKLESFFNKFGARECFILQNLHHLPGLITPVTFRSMGSSSFFDGNTLNVDKQFCIK
jgi:hypothetical protein